LIGGEQKFVLLAFIRETIAQRRKPSKMPTWQYFVRVLASRVSPLNQEFGQDKNRNLNYDRDEELWHQEYLFPAKNMGSLGDGLSLGWPPCEVALSLSSFNLY
jgi:hypothetical protein